jgi:hypothetical protein
LFFSIYNTFYFICNNTFRHKLGLSVITKGNGQVKKNHFYILTKYVILRIVSTGYHDYKLIKGSISLNLKLI